VLALAGLPAEARDIRVCIPLDYASGFATRGDVRPFEGGLRLAALARLGDHGTVQAGPAAAYLYDGADGTLAGGLRAGVRVAGLRDAGVFAFAEWLHGRDRTPLSLLVLADLPVRRALFVRFGVVAGRDLERDDTSLGLTLGTDLARWAHALFGRRRPRTVPVED
jgi:hypothetical protein